MPATPFPTGDIGPVRGFWGNITPEAADDLGITMSCNITVEEQSAEVTNAEGGTVSVDDITTGTLVTVTLVATQSSLTQLALMSNSLTRTVDELMISSSVGESLRYDNSGAQPLVLKRVTNGTVSADLTEWITFFDAAPKVDADWVFDAATQRVTTAIFRCYAAEAVLSGETYSIGDIGAPGYGQTS